MNNFRPKLLADIIGQEQIKQYLKISLDAAKKKDKPVPHILFSGPSGLGKTTLAIAIANELDRPIQIGNGAKMSSAKFVAPYITKATANSVLFIDEVHRLPKSVQEFLYPVLEDSKLVLSTETSTMEVELPPFTILAATTNTGGLAEPFQNRFQTQFNLEYYSQEEMAYIGKHNLNEINISCQDDIVYRLCSRCKNTPRILNNYINWLGDYCVSTGSFSLGSNGFEEAMKMLGVDEHGYNKNDRDYIKLLKEQYGSPIGITTIASILNLSRDTIVNFIEPYLLKTKVIRKTPAGRILRQVKGESL